MRNMWWQVPTLSHWYHDIAPFYMCCLWQEEQAVGCETFRFERRPTQDCVAYQSPSVGQYCITEVLAYLLFILILHCDFHNMNHFQPLCLATHISSRSMTWSTRLMGRESLCCYILTLQNTNLMFRDVLSSSPKISTGR